MRISNLIKRLEHIKEAEGDFNVYHMSDGIPKLLDNAITLESDDRKICLLE